MADPFEEFEFKPLTEGLGFHKKAEKIKTDIKATNLGRETARPSHSSIFADFEAPVTPTAAPAFKAMTTPSSSTLAARETMKTASQSISELMASLPPSLDFLDDKQDLTRPSESVRASTLSFSTTSSSASSAPTAPLAGPSGAGAMASDRSTDRSNERMMDRPQIFQPLAREEYKATLATGPTVGSVLPAPGTKAGASLSMTPAAAAVQAPLIQPSPYRDRMTEGFAKAFPQGEKAKAATTATPAEAAAGLVPVAANFAAALIDAMVVAGISTILLVCIITITKINLIALLTNASTDGSTQLNLVFLATAVLQIYMLISRAFAGATLGEWAFDLQVGTNEQQRKLSYPAQVLWRSVVTTVTGLILLPLLSFAFNRDLSKYLTGLQLYRRL